MAKLIIVNPSPIPHRKYLILGILIGIAFDIIAVSGVKTQPSMPIYFKDNHVLSRNCCNYSVFLETYSRS